MLTRLYRVIDHSSDIRHVASTDLLLNETGHHCWCPAFGFFDLNAPDGRTSHTPESPDHVSGSHLLMLASFRHRHLPTL
jgi:hypothetical protein